MPSTPVRERDSRARPTDLRPRLVWILVLALVTSLALTSSPVVDLAEAGHCRGQSAKPRGKRSIRMIRRATRCLVNERRRANGRAPLDHTRALRRAAQRHAGSMVRRDYFSHTGYDGSDVGDRTRAAGYGGARMVGEVIAWGKGRAARARRIVQRWMRSSGHRRLILNGTFRDIGVGVYRGAPYKGDRGAATYTVDFGRR